MFSIEVRPGEGGADAAAFAQELAKAISRNAGVAAEAAGDTWLLHRL